MGLYAPWADDSHDLIRATHRQKFTVTLTPAGGDPIAPTVIAARLSFNEDWSPYGDLALTFANDLTAAQLAALDPRTNPPAVDVAAGYVRGDGSEDVHPVFAGYLHEREANSRSRTVDAKGYTLDGLTHEVGYLGADTFMTWPSVRAAAEWAAGYATQQAVQFTPVGNVPTRPDLTAGVPVPAGRPIWDILGDLVLGARVRIYADENRQWIIGPKTTEAAQVRAYLSEGGGGIVDGYRDTLARADYAGAAVVVYRWRDSGGVDRTVTGTYGAPGAKTYREERQGAATQAQANEAAASIVQNLSTRGDGYRVDGAAAYWLRPGHTVQVTLANGTESRHIVRQIDFDLVAGTMTVITRQPSNIT